LIPWTLIEVAVGVIAGGVAVYLVAIQGMKVALQKEAKGMAIEQVLKQVGLNRAKVKDFNDLTPQGVVNLCTVIKAVQTGSGSTMGGSMVNSAIAKQIAAIQQLAQMGQNVSGATGPQAQSPTG
jgi:hypothetical protein